MTQEIINKWLEETKDELIANYYRLGLNASENWPKQLESFSKEQGKGYNIGIKGERYTGAIEYGRLPNKNQDPEYIRRWAGWAGSTFIKQWVKDKGLNLNPFAVAYKIAKEGWKVPNAFNAGGLVSDVVDKKLPELERALIFGLIEETKTDMINTLKYGYQ